MTAVAGGGSAGVTALWSGSRLAGGLMVAGLTIGVAVIVAVTLLGDIRATEAQFRSLEAAVGHTGSLRAMSFGWAVPMLFVLGGTVILAVELIKRGSTYLPAISVVAFALFTFAWVLEAAFHAGVTVWAVGELEAGRSIPELFEQLRRWLNVFLQIVVNPLGLLALIGLAVASARTGLLPGWAGWTLVVYCGLVLAFPLPLLIAPAIAFFGLALLVAG